MGVVFRMGLGLLIMYLGHQVLTSDIFIDETGKNLGDGDPVFEMFESLFPVLLLIIAVILLVALGAACLSGGFIGAGSVFDMFSHAYDEKDDGDAKVTSDRSSNEVQMICTLDQYPADKIMDQMASLREKCRLVHAGYQKYPNFNFRRSEFYHTDIPQYIDIFGSYIEAESLPKADVKYMVDTLVNRTKYYDETLDMQKDKLFNRIRVSLDVLRASDH